jgi:hypothetical protein
MSLTRTGWWRPDPSRGASVGEVRALSLVPSAQPAGVDQESWSCEAFELLKRVAQESNTPIAQIAQRVITGDHSVPVKYPR